MSRSAEGSAFRPAPISPSSLKVGGRAVWVGIAEGNADQYADVVCFAREILGSFKITTHEEFGEVVVSCSAPEKWRPRS